MRDVNRHHDRDEQTRFPGSPNGWAAAPHVGADLGEIAHERAQIDIHRDGRDRSHLRRQQETPRGKLRQAQRVIDQAEGHHRREPREENNLPSVMLHGIDHRAELLPFLEMARRPSCGTDSASAAGRAATRVRCRPAPAGSPSRIRKPRPRQRSETTPGKNTTQQTGEQQNEQQITRPARGLDGLHPVEKMMKNVHGRASECSPFVPEDNRRFSATAFLHIPTAPKRWTALDRPSTPTERGTFHEFTAKAFQATDRARKLSNLIYRRNRSRYRLPRLNPSPSSSPTTFYGIQALRGLAAIAVVIHHAQQAIQDYGLGFDLSIWAGGASGVDIFFAISGFIMVYTTVKFWGKAGRVEQLSRRSASSVLFPFIGFSLCSRSGASWREEESSATRY